MQRPATSIRLRFLTTGLASTWTPSACAAAAAQPMPTTTAFATMWTPAWAPWMRWVFATARARPTTTATAFATTKRKQGAILAGRSLVATNLCLTATRTRPFKLATNVGSQKTCTAATTPTEMRLRRRWMPRLGRRPRQGHARYMEKEWRIVHPNRPTGTLAMKTGPWSGTVGCTIGMR